MGSAPAKSLHSRYDPAREAERFVAALGLPDSTEYIVVCEPGESYLERAFRGRFAGSKLISIRLQNDSFLESDPQWDAVWRPGSGQALEAFLMNALPDEALPLVQYVEWPPAAERWDREARETRSAFRHYLEIQKAVMLTRSAFGPRWLKNMATNLSQARSLRVPTIIDSPVFLAGAGPSLECQLELARQAPFSIAVSSALASFKNRSITPGLCVATDGGYWARRYFADLDGSCAVAAPLEAAVPPEILESREVIPLDYGSRLEAELFRACAVIPTPARRNGTVAGTALELALSVSSGPVFAAGLDFRSSKAFSHARPHPSERAFRAAESRLSPTASRFLTMGDGALGVYAEWFENNARRLSGRFSRLAPSGRPLAGIPDSDPADAARVFSKTPGTQDLWRLERASDTDSRDRAQAVASFFAGLAGEFDRRSTPDGLRSSEGSCASLKGEGALGEFMQLASYRGYLEILPLLGRAGTDRAAADRVSAECELMRDAALALGKRATLHGK